MRFTSLRCHLSGLELQRSCRLRSMTQTAQRARRMMLSLHCNLPQALMHQALEQRIHFLG